MKKLVIIYSLISLLLFIHSCEPNSGSEEECIRIGAICNDGTTSKATGSGACSHHGGVKEWICE